MSPQLDLDTLTLAKGAHEAGGAMCVMEAVAFIAGEPWSDRPACVLPVIGAFLRSWNDSLGDDDRQQLKRWIPEIVDTNAGDMVDVELSWMALDWLIRVHTPAWLRLAGLVDHADTLTGMAEVTPETCPSILPVLQAIRKDSYTAQDTAQDTASDTAWDTARPAAWAAAWATASDAAPDAARATARATAQAAARAAARAAAWDTARAALQPTVIELQGSAHELVGRMVAHAKAHIGAVA